MSTPAISNTAVFGSTGLVGSQILSTLLGWPSVKVTTISRRAPKAPESATNLNAIVEPDTTAWASKLTSLSPAPHTVFSGLGTTRAQAGGLANQWKIDHDLNVELAKASKASGVRTFVFISSAGTRSFISSRLPYSKMKIGVEDAVRDLDFENAVIVRPGLIMGEREQPRAGQGVMTGLVRGLGYLGQGLQDSVGQDHDVIARAAVRAAQLVAEGKAPSKYWVLEQADIVRLGRTEWVDNKPQTTTTASS
ncbi:FMP52 protein [Sodiomyces alkalinus F11]|uniref:FMP52 protein n=1 Tax=Sodiomyces alkalinus (strain CBS 110278 / VKM F-3762 / F11) TaxID=1314773 RepID=A0A3N2PQ08_SODAK|nr:FMP52 protein [Sodiomyces alkalinus F11]ROT36589.1 FMP52 protein [Sodiomyces alkalinus F11]